MLRWTGIRADLQPTHGGIYFPDPIGRGVIQGSYLEVVPHSRVVFTWGYEEPGHSVPPSSTVVEITLTPEGKGMRLRLIHRELPPEERDAAAFPRTQRMGKLSSR